MYQIYNRTYAEVMLSCIVDTIGSPIANLCYFALQSYAFFSRWSRPYFAVTVDTVLFTKVNECFFSNTK